MSKRFVFGCFLLFSLLLHSAPASAEEARPREDGVALMTTGAALFATSYGVSLAIGLHATADYIARCGGDGPRPFSEALACIGGPHAMHLMIPVAGPFRALAADRHADSTDQVLLVADGVAQIAGVVLAGIGMAQYVDGRAKRSQARQSSVHIVPRGAGLGLVGTF